MIRPGSIPAPPGVSPETVLSTAWCGSTTTTKIKRTTIKEKSRHLCQLEEEGLGGALEHSGSAHDLWARPLPVSPLHLWTMPWVGGGGGVAQTPEQIGEGAVSAVNLTSWFLDHKQHFEQTSRKHNTGLEQHHPTRKQTKKQK